MKQLIPLLFCVITLAGCAPPEHKAPIHDLQLKDENTVEVNLKDGSQKVLNYNAVRDYLRKRDTPQNRAERLLHSIDQQQQAYRQAKQNIQRGAIERPSKADVLWMARTIYSETKRPYEMELVASVVANRVDDPHYPNTVTEVVKEDWQFTAIHEATTKALHLDMSDYEGGETAWRRAVRTAHHILTLPQELRPLKGVTHFYSPVGMNHVPRWAQNKQAAYRIGNRFAFYRLTDRNTPPTSAR